MSADTHIVLPVGQNTVTGAAPAEDSNVVTDDGLPNTSHPAGAPPDNTGGRYGTGTFLKGAIGYNSPQNNTQAIAYVVVKNGSIFTIAMDVAEAVPGQASMGYHLASKVGEGPPPVPVVALFSGGGGAPSGFGNKLTNGRGIDKATFNPNTPVADSINVTGSNGGYQPGFANNINNGAGESTFFLQASGFSPATDQETYALNIKVGGTDPTLAQDQAIVNDIIVAGYGVTASSVTGQFASLFPGYDILLTGTPGFTAPAYLGINFANDINTPGVVVTDVAAVPEPASAAGMLLGAAGLLLGRRKRNV
jgi:hypothetical protein